jgi:hypothetical protein
MIPTLVGEPVCAETASAALSKTDENTNTRFFTVDSNS